MTTVTVSSGVTSSGLTIGSGTDFQILHGGNAVNIVVSGFGQEEVYGSESRLWVASNGAATVESGGVVHSAMVGSSAELIVLSGGIVSGASVSPGAEMDVALGGYVSGLAVGGNAISGGGALELYGSAVQLTAGPDTDVEILSGGWASGLVLSGDSYTIFAIAAGASATNLTDVGGDLNIGGLMYGATVSDAGLYVTGEVSGAVLSNAQEFVSGGESLNTTVEGRDGYLQLYNGASASGSVIDSGAALIVDGVYIGSGQSVVFTTSAVETSTTTFQGVTLSSGATLYAADYMVSSGGHVVFSGGIIGGATESSGGRVSLNSNTGQVTVYSGAYVDFENQTVMSAGELLLESGGLGAGTVVSSGGLAAAWADSTLDNTLAIGGGVSISGSGSLASGSVLESGGYEFAEAGGSSLAATVSNGGIDYAASGGLVSGAAILTGGVETVEAGGVDSGAVVSLGGRLVISSGGLAVGDAVRGGGAEIVKSGGVVSAAGVSGGGELNVSAGGIVSGGLVMSGGTVILAGSAASGQTLSFTSTAVAVLELNNLSGFAAAIAGMTTSNQKLDLGGFAYSSSESVAWSQSGTSGTLTVTDGAQVANLTLIGAYTTSNFVLSDDGHGGTIVVDPPVAGFAQTMASFGAEAGGGPMGSVDGFTGSSLLAAPPLIPTGTGSAAH